MLLADKIMEERKKNGWSQEELASQLGVSRQSVSKWESAGSIPDIQRIIQMADLFGVTTDYLLKEEKELKEEPILTSQVITDENIRRVSMEEANDYLSIKKKNSSIIANGVSMCILCPVILIVLAAMAEEHIGNISENLAAGIGLVILFGLIAGATFLFITCSMKEEKYKFLEKETFETEYGVTGLAKERKLHYEAVYTRGLALGVVLCILAVVPLILGGLAELPDYMMAILIALLLCLIAAGVNCIVRVSIIRGSYDTLLQEGEYTKAEKRVKKKLDHVETIYWCTVTAIYLGWSFWTMNWHFTWLIWPVAGVFYAAAEGMVRLFLDKD